MYCRHNFKSKTALLDYIDLAEGSVEVFQPNLLPGLTETRNGWVDIEGPHAPEPHTWYAQALIKDGFIVELKV